MGVPHNLRVCSCLNIFSASSWRPSAFPPRWTLTFLLGLVCCPQWIRLSPSCNPPTPWTSLLTISIYCIIPSNSCFFSCDPTPPRSLFSSSACSSIITLYPHSPNLFPTAHINPNPGLRCSSREERVKSKELGMGEWKDVELGLVIAESWEKWG